jgi:hypothetical protein
MVTCQYHSIDSYNRWGPSLSVQYLVEILYVANLTWLCYTHALLFESLSSIIGHGHVRILHQSTIKQKATNDGSSASLPMITMDHHYVFLIL